MRRWISLLTTGLVGLAAIGCGSEFGAAPAGATTTATTTGTSTGGGGSGGTSASAGGMNTGGSGGIPAGYGERECEVPTNQMAMPSSPECEPTDTGCVSDFAGRFGSPGEIDGSAGDARFVGLFGLAVDDEYLYASTAHAIRRISIATGQVTTLAGSGVSGNADGVGPAATFACPRGLAVYDDELYVADSGNNAVRVIHIATGEVSTMSPSFDGPMFLTARSTGESVYHALYVTEHTQVSKVAFTNQSVTVIGNATSPALNAPMGLVWAESFPGFYLADSGNHIIRKLTETQLGPAQVGSPGMPNLTDGQGTAARVNLPHGLALLPEPLTIFVADRDNHALRRVAPGSSYTTTTLAGDGTAGHTVAVGAQAKLTEPTDVVFFSHALFIAEGTVIRRMQLAND